jgi:hypothetical protein
MDGSTAPSLAGGQADNQIGQGDVGPEPRHQAVLAIAFGSTAALAFDAHDGMRELATRVLPPAPARKASDGTRTGGKDAPSAVDYHERAPCVRHGLRGLPARSAATRHRFAAAKEAAPAFPGQSSVISRQRPRQARASQQGRKDANGKPVCACKLRTQAAPLGLWGLRMLSGRWSPP